MFMNGRFGKSGLVTSFVKFEETAHGQSAHATFERGGQGSGGIAGRLRTLGRVCGLLAVLSLFMVGNAAEVEVTLLAPLTTRVVVASDVTGADVEVSATVVVPGDAPADLGVGIAAMDRHGRWFDQARFGVLTPGRHQLRWVVDGAATFREGDGLGRWNSAISANVRTVSLYFWSATASRARLVISDVMIEPREMSPKSSSILSVAHSLAMSTQAVSARTGERWEVAVRPEPFPQHPYDADAFRLEAVITDPEGREQTIPGFCREPQLLSNRGDREMAMVAGAMDFAVRFRARQPGRHQVRIVARWADGSEIRSTLPEVLVTGTPWDGYVHLDRTDPRFFNVAGAWWWPVGLNLHSPNDVRSHEVLGTRLTPDLGTATYTTYLERFAAHGGNAVEIWLAPWNLGLEWNGDWPGFHGMGRYNQGNAERLDRILDCAWRLGVRVNLVIASHGQASIRVDSEWNDHPWNILNGGVLTNPYELFTDPRALLSQQHLRRYLVARYADHPAILAWKLWTEVDLTVAGNSSWATPSPRLKALFAKSGSAAVLDAAPPTMDARLAALTRWHADAAAQLHALDGYGHPVTTHWSNTYQRVHPQVAALPGIDLLCIDAYHSDPSDAEHSPQGQLAKLLWASIDDPQQGLMRYAKGVLVTEYGGSSQGSSDASMRADHACGAWAALVGGHAGSPLLWWHEWVDQGDHWQPYAAISAFIAGEDLRGGGSHDCVVTGGSGDVAGRLWMQTARVLAYVVDLDWNRRGGALARQTQVQIALPALPAGTWQGQWWDADRGIPGPTFSAVHVDGEFVLSVPEFSGHVALKMWLGR